MNKKPTHFTDIIDIERNVLRIEIPEILFLIKKESTNAIQEHKCIFNNSDLFILKFF